MKAQRRIGLVSALSVLLALPCVATTNETTQRSIPEQTATLAERPALLHATLAERLCSIYSQIKSVSCEIRKSTNSGGRTIRMLSRIHYRAPNFLHVDNVSPTKRTIIADGERLYYHQQGIPRGFSRPIEELSETWRAPLRNIPGTPLEHLLPLRELPEIELPATAEGFIRRAYQSQAVYVVLTADTKDRLQRIDFFKSRDMKTRTGEYTFSHFKEELPGCWIPSQYKATLYLPADEVAVETRRTSNFAPNEEIPDALFNHELFIKDVTFVDEFKKTYQ
jgi:hypothetical protein